MHYILTYNKISEVAEKYSNNLKFPDKYGLLESCLIIRKHNDKNCINIMDKWFNEIKNYSHRDQLSFNYIIWKKKYKILSVELSSTNIISIFVIF
jgi:hypothetical protein